MKTELSPVARGPRPQPLRRMALVPSQEFSGTFVTEAATEARDKTCEDLRTFMQELKGVARGGLRRQTRAAAKLELST